MARAKTGDNATVTAVRSSKSRTKYSRQVTNDDIAARAHALYLARGGEHGLDVDDWLQAEQQLRETARLTDD